MTSIRELIDARAQHSGEVECIIEADTHTVLTYYEIKKCAVAIAQFVSSQGVRSGESVAFAMSNSPLCAITILGLFYGGYRATAINLVSGSSTIGHVIKHSKTRLILSEQQQFSLLNEAFKLDEEGIEIIDVASEVFSSLPIKKWASTSVDAAVTNSGDSPTADIDALLMYTSGTTGLPKGVVLTHKNLLAGGSNTAMAHELNSTDRALCVLPLYHINGLCVTLMAPLVSVGSVVIPKRFSTSQFWRWIVAYKCSWFSVVPTQVSYLLHAEKSDYEGELSSQILRFGRTASAPLSPEVQQAFEQRFGVSLIETMGLTETSAQILSNPLPPGMRKVGSPGIAYGDEVIIADSNLKPVSSGVEGELLVRGDNIMKEYFSNPKATREVLTDDGWLRTGDLGKQDEDGYFYITGRLKELIIKGGENIAPREIDEALYQCSSVIEAAAFAVPCTSYGERVEAAVSVGSDSTIEEADLLKICQSTLGEFKSPDRIHFLDELPKGPSGKIQRLKLTNMLAPGQN